MISKLRLKILNVREREKINYSIVLGTFLVTSCSCLVVERLE